ncbi:MAG: efflux RND transporter periplasmic adaptor subunit [Calothrix sp. MO_192.B10]|nr:efflux RND transporter periplasmic adaptor subunit [Calothrix sp. MO_192.B10]
MKSSESQSDFEQNFPEPSFEPPLRQGGWLWLFFAVLIIITGGAALGLLMSPEHQISSNNSNQVKTKRVKISTVGVGKIEESYDYIASLEPLNSITLQPKIQGTVTHVFVKSGNKVKAGSAIIQVNSQGEQSTAISSRYYQAQQKLDRARDVLNRLQTARLSQLAHAKLNQQQYQRYSLLAAQGAVSRQTRDEYAQNLAAVEMNLGAIDAKIQAQQVRVLQAEQALKQAYKLTQQPSYIQRYKITAPVTGIITSIPVKVGDIINTSTKIGTITQNQPLEIKINVPKKLSFRLRKGMPVEVMSEQGKKLGKTRIYLISQKKGDSKFIVVKALLKNTKSKLRTDELVRARLIFNRRPGALIPRAAIFRVAEESFVYVAETIKLTQNNSQLIARQRRIKLGNIRGNTYQVLGGLQPGERIVVSGLLNLRDGDRISP